MVFPVFQVPGLEYFTDQPEKPVIMDLLRQDPHEDLMADGSVAVGDITLDESRDPGPGILDFPQRGMTAAPLPEPVRAARKPRLVIRLQQDAHHFAGQLI